LKPDLRYGGVVWRRRQREESKEKAK
jgi:hypothetical protein